MTERQRQRHRKRERERETETETETVTERQRQFDSFLLCGDVSGWDHTSDINIGNLHGHHA